MQATVLPVIWQNYIQYGIAKDLLDMLETKFGKAGGALTYLQLVNMVKISFTDMTELLPQIQQLHESTAWQYLNNITVIANYKLLSLSVS